MLLGVVGLFASVIVGTSALLAWSLSPAGDAGAGEPLFLEIIDPSPEAVTAQLSQAGLIRSPRLFGFYLKVLPGADVQPGEHFLRRGLSPRELVARLARLPGRLQATVVVPEGFNRKKIAARLEKSEICRAKAFLDATEEPKLLAELGVPGASAEGYLFPATYQLAADTAPADVVSRMAREGKKRLEQVRLEHPGAFEALANKGYSEQDVVTLASIVEKETGISEERPLIASVFFNRLADPSLDPKGRLQSDPTAAYGCEFEPDVAASCTTYSGKVTPAMLRDADNRYNTYRHPGLPPGPIASPGRLALEAVLSPAKSDYLYFVADGGGKHTFTRSFEEHRAAVERLRALRGPSQPPALPASTGE